MHIYIRFKALRHTLYKSLRDSFPLANFSTIRETIDSWLDIGRFDFLIALDAGKSRQEIKEEVGLEIVASHDLFQG